MESETMCAMGGDWVVGNCFDQVSRAVSVPVLVDVHGTYVKQEVAPKDRCVSVLQPGRSMMRVSEAGLNDTEQKCIDWFTETFCVGGLEPRRMTEGLDFLYGNVGIEVKSGRGDWSFTERQRDDLEVFPVTIVLKALGDDGEPWVDAVYVDPDNTIPAKPVK